MGYALTLRRIIELISMI